MSNTAPKLRILGIETSCDETALSIIEAEGGIIHPKFKLIDSTLLSQIDVHKEFGGVVPMIAKREHAKNLIPLFKKLLGEIDYLETPPLLPKERGWGEVEKILEKEPELLKQFLEFIPKIKKPNIEAIAVTYGPGLEPALWVGVSFAKALGFVWNLPVIPTNHMEGHIISPLLDHPESIQFPALALLISGGHTELINVTAWGDYKIIGGTKDDAVGEAFDKVARLLGLPYPGGPQISKLAHEAREKKYPRIYELPRPMIHTPNFDFSFSGLKTAVLYTVRKQEKISHTEKCDLAREFEDAVTEVLITKTKKALEEINAKTLIIGGGVIANGHIRGAFETLVKEYADVSLRLPSQALSTDNATMIAMAGYISYLGKKHESCLPIKAHGNASLGPLGAR